MEQKTVTTAIEQLKKSTQKPSNLSQKSSLQVQNLRQHFPSFKTFATKFNPDSQITFAADERNAIMGDYSTFATLDLAYGENTSVKWLIIQINDLNKFVGSKTMDKNQTRSLSFLLASEYKDVKFSMMQLFFYRFKRGDFGKFYGKVDPMVITCALKDFVEECAKKRDEYLTEEFETRKKEQINFDESAYLAWHHLMTDLLNKVSADDKVILSSISPTVKGEYLILELTERQYGLMTQTYVSLYTSLIKNYFSQLRQLYFQYQIIPSDAEEQKTLLNLKTT